MKKYKNLLKKIYSQSKSFYHQKTERGFTLIETLVAITVLVLSITGPLQIAANSLFSSFYARDQITAYYLAEEAIEYAKNARDTTFLSDVFTGTGNNDWLKGLEVCVNDGVDHTDGCYIDTLVNFSSGNAVHQCVEECPAILYDTNTNLWGYINGNPTKFVRTVRIVPQGSLTFPRDEAIIKVKVEWTTQSIFGTKKSFELAGAMMNWQRK